MRRQDKPRREAKKEKQDNGRVSRRGPKEEPPDWTRPKPAPLREPRECKYKKIPGHHLISCPDCENLE